MRVKEDVHNFVIAVSEVGVEKDSGVRRRVMPHFIHAVCSLRERFNFAVRWRVETTLETPTIRMAIGEPSSSSARCLAFSFGLSM